MRRRVAGKTAALVAALVLFVPIVGPSLASASTDVSVLRHPGLADDSPAATATDTRAPARTTVAAWDGRRGWLYHVATAADHRRTGLGRELVERAEAALRALGAQRVLVIVEASNAPAFEFWRALGSELRDTRQLGKSL